MGTILHNYGTFSLDIGPDDQPKKNQKKNHLYLCTILHNYGTSSLDIGPDDQPKKIKKKIKKKNQKKNQNEITFIYAPYYTIMELLYWTLDLMINPKKSKKIKNKIKSPLSMHHTIQLWNFCIGHWT